MLFGLAGLTVLAPTRAWARALLALAVLPGLAAGVAWVLPGGGVRQTLPPFPIRVAAATVANLHAWVRALRAVPDLHLEPVPRPLFRMRL